MGIFPCLLGWTPDSQPQLLPKMMCEPMPSSVRTRELFDSVTMLRAHGKCLQIISDLCSRTVPLPRKLSLCRLFQLFFLHPFHLSNSFLTLSDFKPVSFSTCECASWNYPHLRLFTHLKKLLNEIFSQAILLLQNLLSVRNEISCFFPFWPPHFL